MQEFFNSLGVNINVTFHLLFLGLIWVRLLAMTSVIPFLFGKPVPRSVVTAATLFLAIYGYLHLVPQKPPPLDESVLNISLLFLKEIFYGFLIGIAISIIFYGIQAAGAMVDNQRGVSIARVLIPQLNEQGSLTGTFLFQFAIVLFLVTGGHLQFLETFFLSYQKLPLLAYPTIGDGFIPLIELFIHITAEVLLISIQLAAPVIIALFLADIILGIANRIAPQINVWELGFNVKGFAGVLLLFIAITMIGEQIVVYTVRANHFVVQVVEHLMGKEELSKDIRIEMPEEGLLQPDDGPPPVTTP